MFNCIINLHLIFNPNCRKLLLTLKKNSDSFILEAFY